MHYNRLFFLVGLINAFIFGRGAINGWWWNENDFLLANILAPLLANIALATLIRQQYVVNILFAIATSAPTSWPLAIRRRLGKVYHFGGLHVGGAVFGTLWFAFFCGDAKFSLFHWPRRSFFSQYFVNGCYSWPYGRNDRYGSLLLPGSLSRSF